MSGELSPAAPGVYASKRAAAWVTIADLVVFDVDGVLVDVSRSLPAVVAGAVEHYLAELGFSAENIALDESDIADFKAAAGFNSDWDLAYAAVLFYLAQAIRYGHRDVTGLKRATPTLRQLTVELTRTGGGPAGFADLVLEALPPSDRRVVQAELQRERLEQWLMEIYAGDRTFEVYGYEPERVRGPGLITRERALLSPADLLPGVNYGIYTGRTRGELRHSLGVLGLQGLFADEATVTTDDGMLKPDPRGLRTLCARFRPRAFLYVGDNVDDWVTWARYASDRTESEPPGLFAGVLDGSPAAMGWSQLQDRGVELLVDSVASLLGWMNGLRRETGRAAD